MDAFGDLSSLGERIRRIMADESVELTIHALDLIEAGLRDRAR